MVSETSCLYACCHHATCQGSCNGNRFSPEDPLFEVRILSENHEVLHDGRHWQVLLCRELGAVLVIQQDRSSARLEAGDLLRAPCLTGDIYCLANPHGHLELLEILVERDEPT